MMKPESHGQARLGQIVQPPAREPAPRPGHLQVAGALVTCLADAGIRYGVYKNCHAVTAGLAGANDLDLLVATADIARFETLLRQFKAVCGRPHPLHDNVVEGRSQWFVPDFSSGDYLHLDVVAGLRIGHRFAKRHLALDYDDVREWQSVRAPLPPMPIVSRREEARIALLKAIHDLSLSRYRDWVPVSDRLAPLLAEAVGGGPDGVIQYRVGPQEVACRVRTRGRRVEVEGEAVRRLVRSLLGHDRDPGHAQWADLALHHARRLAYVAARAFAAATPLRSIGKVTLPAGILVALVGPDGVGKSTQSARLRMIFGKKFNCTTVYLGSGDGGWAPRRALRRGFERWRAHAHDGASRRPGELAGAVWGFVTALERYLALRKASRALARGLIVITDRWPQNLRPGLLDGPRRPPGGAAGTANWLSRVEQALYRRMAMIKPTDTVHLVSTFEASNARKPGDIDRSAFEQRLDLMRTLRMRDPAIKTVDAGPAADEVTLALFRIAWLALWRAATEEESRPRSASAAHNQVRSPA